MRPLEDLLRGVPLPDADGSKHDRGSVVVLGGPPACPGAVVLAGEAALRVGAGRVQLVVHPEVRAVVGAAVPEALVLAWDLCGPVPAEVGERLSVAGAVLLGPGTSAVPPEVVGAVVRAAGGPTLVLDAGALSGAGAAHGAPLVLAPNTAEARELAGAVEEGVADEGRLATVLARRFGRPVAVRGAQTVLADADGRAWRQAAQPPGLGTPGSGDVLVGVLAGLLALGAAPVEALGWAVWLHAQAGALEVQYHPRGYLARDVLRRLPEALLAGSRGLAASVEGNGSPVQAEATRP